MKIAFLNFYQNRNRRGAETFVEELGKRLTNHLVTVYSGNNNEADWSIKNEKYRFGWRVFVDYWSLRVKNFTQRVLAEIDPETDIIIPTNGGWQSMLCKIWAVRHNKKILISGQSGKGWIDRTNLFIRPDCFVALTDYQKKWAEKWGFGVRIEKIPNGVDLEKYSSKVPPVKFNLVGKVALCVAALEKDKRVDLVIKAVSKVNGLNLVVLGEGPERENLINLADLLLKDRFLLTSVENYKMPGYYTASDLVTMVPVLNESFGIVYLEALASGKPVVAAADTSRKEIIGDAGILINPENIIAYTQALEKALEIDWKDKPRKQAEKFSWDKIAQEYEKLFNSLNTSNS